MHSSTILYIIYLLHISALSASSGSLRQDIIKNTVICGVQ